MAASFFSALGDESLRQDYCNRIHELCPESVSAVLYDPEGKRMRERVCRFGDRGWFTGREVDYLLSTEPNSFEVVFSMHALGRGDPHPIFVGAHSFRLLNEPRFINCVVDHEALPARHLMEGLEVGPVRVDYQNVEGVRHQLALAVSEIIAYRYQLSKTDERDISDVAFISWIRENLDTHRIIMEQISSPVSSLEEDLRRNVRALFNPG